MKHAFLSVVRLQDVADNNPGSAMNRTSNFLESDISQQRERETRLAPALVASPCSPCLAISEAHLNSLDQT